MSNDFYQISILPFAAIIIKICRAYTLKLHQKFPDLLPPEHLPIIALAVAGGLALLMFCFSAKIYQWEVRVTYGRVFDKLKDTIAEMETLNRDY